MAQNGLAPSGDSTGKDQHVSSQNGSYGDPESPEVTDVLKAASSSQRRPFRSVENIRAQMTLCETYNGLAIDKVSSAATNNIRVESKYGVNHQPIEAQYVPNTTDSQLKPPYFANSNKRKRECDERLEGENGDMSTEADQMLTQNSFDGDHTMERKEASYPATDEPATTSVDDHPDDDEEMIAEKPRMVRWFKFCVIDTGIGWVTCRWFCRYSDFDGAIPKLPAFKNFVWRAWFFWRHVLENDVDWGDRIKASDLGLLFEKFEQCSTSTTSTYGGTGLGLAVSKKLVISHRETVFGESWNPTSASWTNKALCVRFYAPRENTMHSPPSA